MKAFETVLGRKCTKSAIVLWYDHAIPHMKALICGYLEPEAQGHGSSLILCHALTKRGILYEKSGLCPLTPLIGLIVGSLFFDTSFLLKAFL